jgi:magnesium transporter
MSQRICLEIGQSKCFLRALHVRIGWVMMSHRCVANRWNRESSQVTFFNKRYHPPGTPAGTLTESVPEAGLPLRLHLTDFNRDRVIVEPDASVSACESALANDSVTWVHVQGRPTEHVLNELGRAFKLHILAMEDVLNSGQRPKVETYDDQLFVVVSLPLMEADIVTTQQVSIYIGSGFVVSFHDGDFQHFEAIIARLQQTGNRIQARGPDFLLYSLLDMVIDHGFPVLERFGLQLEALEMEILDVTGRESLEKIHVMKRELILLRRMLWPQRELINQLLRGDSGLIADGTMVYLRDCYDHTIQVMELLETYRDMTTSMLDIYLSSVSHRLNEVMRLLTMIATLFIPLTFIVGVYGMNFDRTAGPLNMPELGSPYGYLFVWVGMIVVAVAMLVFFRRKGWF